MKMACLFTNTLTSGICDTKNIKFTIFKFADDGEAIAHLNMLTGEIAADIPGIRSNTSIAHPEAESILPNPFNNPGQTAVVRLCWREITP